MTTDEVKGAILKYHAIKGLWPNRTELELALQAQGYMFDQMQLDDLLEGLSIAHQVWLQDGVFVAKV